MKFSANDNYSIFNFPLNIWILCMEMFAYVHSTSHQSNYSHPRIVVSNTQQLQQIKRFPIYIMLLGNEQNRKKVIQMVLRIHIQLFVLEWYYIMGDGDDQDKIKFKCKWLSQFAGYVSHHNGPFFQFLCQKDSFIL